MSLLHIFRFLSAQFPEKIHFFCIISEIIDRSKLNCICCLISIIDS